MVKTLAFHGNIEFAPPQDVFKFLYEDDAFTKRYHQEVNYDEAASVTSWSEDGKREVRFKPRVTSLPRLLQSIVGYNLPQVTETQKYIKNDNVITIHSELPIDLPLSALISGDTNLSSDGKGGCSVDINMTFDVKSAIQGYVETYMEKDAEPSFRRWMNIARVFCEEKMGLEKESLLKDDFYDTSDTMNDVVPPAEVGQAATSDLKISTSGPTEGLPLQQVGKHLKNLDEKVRKLERDLLSLRSSLESHQRLMSNAWSICGLGIATGLALVLLYLMKRKKQR